MKLLTLITAFIITSTSWAAPLLLDVRSDREFQKDNIKGSVHIPHTKIDALAPKLLKDKSQVIRVYCAAGVRAQHAVNDLQKLGYKHAINVGGIDDIRHE